MHLLEIMHGYISLTYICCIDILYVIIPFLMLQQWYSNES